MRHVFSTVLVLLFCAGLAAAQCTYVNDIVTDCDYYTAPGAGTSGCITQGSPCSIAHIVDNLVGAGDKVCLLPGTYTGQNYMIDVGEDNANVDGTSGNPITFCGYNRSTGNYAILDGGGGSSGNQVIVIENSDYIYVEYVMGHNGDTDEPLVALEQEPGCNSLSCMPNFNTLDHIAVWDDVTLGVNVHTISIQGGQGNIVRDSAVISGRSRKTFEMFRTLGNVAQRLFLVWDGTAATGVKQLFSCEYHSYDSVCVNIIGLHRGPYFTNANNGIYGGPIDRVESGDQSVLGLSGREGSLGYDGRHIQRGNLWMLLDSHYTDTGFTLTQGVRTGGRFGQNSATSLSPASDDWSDLFVYCDPNVPDCNALLGFNIREYDGDLSDQNTYSQLTAVGAGTGFQIHSSQTGNVANASTFATLGSMPGGETLYTGSQTANLCLQYDASGMLTSTKLWPWPQNQMIIDAYNEAGMTPIDVTSLITSVFGAPPTQCFIGGAQQPGIVLHGLTLQGLTLGK